MRQDAARAHTPWHRARSSAHLQGARAVLVNFGKQLASELRHSTFVLAVGVSAPTQPQVPRDASRTTPRGRRPGRRAHTDGTAAARRSRRSRHHQVHAQQHRCAAPAEDTHRDAGTPAARSGQPRHGTKVYPARGTLERRAAEILRDIFFYIKKMPRTNTHAFRVRRACWYAAQRVLCACPALSRGGARARPVSRGIESRTPACVAPVARAGAGRDLTRWHLHAGAHMQSTSACRLDGSQAANTQQRTHSRTHARTRARTPSHLSTRLLTYSLSHTSHTLSHAHAALRQDGGNGRADPPRLPGSHPWRCSGFVQVCARVCAPPHARVSATPRCVSALWRVSVCGCVLCI